MSQPPPNDPYQGPPPGMPPQGPHTGGQPPMGPPTGGQPPMGPPPGGPGMPGDPYNQGDPYGHGGDPYNQGGAPYGQPGDPYAQQHGDPYAQQHGNPYAAPPVDPYGNPYGQQPPQQKKKSPWLFLGLGCAALFVIGVVLVVLLVVVFNGNDSDPSVAPRDPGENSQDNDPGVEDPEAPEAPADPEIDTSGMETIGDEFEHEGLTYVVTGVDVVDELQGYTPAGEYLVVEIDVADPDGSSTSFWMDEQHVYEDDGTQYEEDYDLTREINGGSVFVSLDAGGAFSSVTIAFDVPDASAITHMGVSSETYGGNETNVSLVD
ncbi:hypothetical protein AB0I72_10675 [Nocardiopsis sp. NPDC049922]|uniref:hypothetical protein n=1 Tax=Nocardiopsis sp. NPDC049922 TaxID=3155157 RepID=UPI0033CE17E1